MSFLRVMLACLIVVWAMPAAAARPILAVFDIEIRLAKVSPTVRSTLADYLAVQATASGRYQAVPRAQVRRRLRKSRHESYKRCYSTKCQIEIGRQLAATHALNTQIVGMRNKCLLLASIYNLRTALPGSREP